MIAPYLVDFGTLSMQRARGMFFPTRLQQGWTTPDIGAARHVTGECDPHHKNLGMNLGVS